MGTGLARITVQAPQRRLDVALPEHVPLAELLPDVLRHAGVGLADDGERHGGWLLRRADGAPLVNAAGLFSQGVRDGEVLHLVPARTEWPELEYDDVAEAIAEGARRHGGVWTPDSTRAATLAAAAVLLGLGLFAVLGAGPRWGAAAFVGLGVAVLLVLAAAAASRAYGDAPAGTALGAGALPFAFAGGALLVASGDPVGVLAPVPWLGGPELLSGAVSLLVVAMLAAAGVAASVRVFAAGCTVGLFAALAALTGLVTSAAGAAAVLLAVAVCGLGGLPLLAIRFGRLPMPPVNLPRTAEDEEGFTGASSGVSDPARELPDSGAVFAVVSRTEDLLAGLLLGHAVLVAGASVVLATTGGTAARILVAISATALLLRSRLFVTLRQRVPLVAAGLAAVAALGVDLLVGAAPVSRAAVTLGALLLALVTVVAGATYARRPPSPYLGRAADILDTLVVVAVIPVAFAVLGLYGRVADIGP
jgi:type VII secretion integral membrane protein EccD